MRSSLFPRDDYPVYHPYAADGARRLIGSVQMARYVTKPLSRLELAVNEVEQGNLDANFAIRGTLETEKSPPPFLP